MNCIFSNIHCWFLVRSGNPATETYVRVDGQWISDQVLEDFSRKPREQDQSDFFKFELFLKCSKKRNWKSLWTKEVRMIVQIIIFKQ